MHQKKSEIQIGKESSGISSDFNPNYHKNPQFFSPISPKIASINPNSNDLIHTQIKIDEKLGLISSNTTPHKRQFVNPNPNPNPNPNCLVKSPTLPYNIQNYPFSKIPKSSLDSICYSLGRCPSCLFFVFSRAKTVTFSVIRRVRVHIRLLLLLLLPFFYFLVSHPSHSFLLDFLSAFLFSSALLFSLNLALPRLPSIRVFLSRSLYLPVKFKFKCKSSKVVTRVLPVFWSIGSRSRSRNERLLCSGCFVEVYSNGDVYEGEFHKGKCSGSGVYYYYMSGRYEGDWVDGKYDGNGVETWVKGSRYRGQYRQGLRHGFGVYRFYTGDVYGGEWSNGQCHGCGVHTCEDGSRYVGEFKWGVKHGLGHYHFRNGDSYAGEYFADKIHGFGVYKFGNGHRFEGAWHEGRRQGLGMYTFRSGETQAGHWHNGILDVPSTQSATNPVSPIAVNHSKVLNAVQEARRAAEKAYDVPKVDERASRAVAAANRAANAARVAAVKAVQKQMHHGVKHDRFPVQVV